MKERMATKKKPAKKTKNVKNGHNKKVTNGHSRDRKAIDEAETLRVFPATRESSADELRFQAIEARLRQEKSEGPPIKVIMDNLAEEVAAFRDSMVEKYMDYYGHDLRRNVAWYMEQYGLGILSNMERVKAKERQKLIAENQAREAASETAEK